MKFNKLLILVPIAFIVSNCTTEYINDGRVVCFDQEVYPLLVSSCTQSGCHNSNDYVSRLDYSTYAGILHSVQPGSYRNSRLYDVLTANSNPMPPPPYAPFTKEQIVTVCLWIEQGAHTDTCTAETCDTSFVSYSGTIKPILVNFCNGCHDGRNAQTSINYNNFAGIKATVTDGKLIGSINRAPGTIFMPKNGNKLSDCKIAAIQKWVNSGAPNN